MQSWWKFAYLCRYLCRYQCRYPGRYIGKYICVGRYLDAVLVEVSVPDHGDGGAAGVGAQVPAARIRARHAWTGAEVR